MNFKKSVPNYFNEKTTYREYSQVTKLKYGVNPHQNNAKTDTTFSLKFRVFIKHIFWRWAESIFVLEY